jgi:hypothetical protein
MKGLKQYLSKNFFCHLAEDDVEGGNVIAVTAGVPELGLLVEPAAARLGRIKQTLEKSELHSLNYLNVIKANKKITKKLL